ncbi:MAG TPA: bacillithiol biosynthesis deacetylase BshB1, partial [Phnomibacter sp.]|nr:bacillithiol biosynthesis deacetylase BshB1 [Phnomibacter sp.]
AIKAFATQFNAPPQDEAPKTYISSPQFLQGIVERAASFGRVVGVPYAEGFLTDKLLAVQNLDSFIQRPT